jgi:hypothetical protein
MGAELVATSNNILCAIWTEKHRVKSVTAINNGFAIGMPRFIYAFMQGGSQVLRMNFSANKPIFASPKNFSIN